VAEIRKDVLEAAVAFKNEMRKVGKGFKFAKAKDITKTYHYRWFCSFLDKCYRNGFNSDSVKEVVRAVVLYAKEYGLLNKGVALLSRSDIVDICIKNMEKEVQDTDDHLSLIRSAVEIIDVDDPVRMLTKKQHRHGSPNIIALRDNGKLPDFFIAISKSCMKAVADLKCDDLPTVREYFITRMKMKTKFGDEVLGEVMGGEYNG